jgi:flagellin-like protein
VGIILTPSPNKILMSLLTSRRKGVAGLDALIIFIAIVLVVAVTAAILLSTSSTLMQHSGVTQKEKTRSIQRPIVVENVWARDTNSDKKLDELVFLIRLRAGDEPIGFNETVITLNSKVTNCSALSYGPDTIQDCNYSFVYGKKGIDWSQDSLGSGDVVDVHFSGPNIINSVEDQDAHFTFIPSHGLPTEIKMYIPPRISPANVAIWPLND